MCTKAEGVGGPSLSRREGKKKNIGLYIINCQSFAKIKASLGPHIGDRSPQSQFNYHFARVVQKKHKYAVS